MTDNFPFEMPAANKQFVNQIVLQAGHNMITIDVPTLIVPLGACTGKIVASPDHRQDTGSGTRAFRAPGELTVLLPTRGDWDVENLGAAVTVAMVPVLTHSGAQFYRRRGIVAPTHGSVSYSGAGASTQILAANADAAYRLIRNDSAITVYIALGAAATTAGWPLLPGEAMELSVHGPLHFVGQINAYGVGSWTLVYIEGL